MAHAAVSVIVPVRNGGEALEACLDALAAQEGAPDFEVIVVDNGSDDGSAEVARRHPLHPRVVAEARSGSYAARNAGIEAAEADVLAFTDADCTPATRWLAAGYAAIERGAGLVAGAIAMHRSQQPTVAERYDRAVYLRQEDLVRHLGWAVTANLFVRRAVVDSAGPFDPTLVSGGDREFCLRATGHGFTLVYAPDAVVGHAPRTKLTEIWKVNRRIGTGIRQLSQRDNVAVHWRSPDLRQPLGWVVDCVNADGPRLRRRTLVRVHAVAMAARWVGFLARR